MSEIFRRLGWSAVALFLLFAPAHAQTTPQFTSGGNVFGRLSSQWNQYFGAKGDVTNGVFNNPTLNDPIINGSLNLTANQITAALGYIPPNPANNLSDAYTSVATARTNLGLGSMSTQDAGSVAITGGTIAGVSLTVPFTSVTGTIAGSQIGSGTITSSMMATGAALANLGSAFSLSTSGTYATSNTTASTSTATGAIIDAGGLGVAGTTNIGGSLNVDGAIAVFGSTAGTIAELAAGNGNYSVGSAQITDNLAAGVNQYVTAWSGYAINNQPGGAVFGLFGRADLYTTGVATNELDSFNYAAAPSGTLPPNVGFGTTDYLPIAEILAPYGNYASAIGEYIAGGGGGGQQAFQTGIYIGSGATTTYGMLIDATSSVGPTAGIVVRGTATSIPFTVEDLGSPSAGLHLIQALNPSGSPIAWINANGDFGNAGFSMASAGLLYFVTPTLSPASDCGSGTATGCFEVVIEGTPREIPYY